MKSVQLKDVFKYRDSDSWLYEEFSAKVLLVSPSFLGYNSKICVKVIEFIIIYRLQQKKYVIFFLNYTLFIFNKI